MNKNLDFAKKRIEKLKQEINFHRYNYHVLDKESISEAALDSLKNELFKLELEFPQFISSDSPTQKVGGKALDKFEKSTHFSPMLSLFDAFSEDDMRSWQERSSRFLFNSNNFNNYWNYYCELKLDGLAVNIKYKNTEFVEASSRGDGKIGENISSNIKVINSVPLKFIIPKESDLKKICDNPKEVLDFIKSSWIEVRGEAIMTKSDFNKLNSKYKLEGKNILSNTRNGAAGSLRQLDPALSAERSLQFYAYDIIFYDKNFKKLNVLKSRESADILAKILGFKVIKENSLKNNLNDVFEFHRYWEKNKENLDFNIDGLVVKVNNLDFWDKLGVIGKAPRYAMAYKFSAEQGSSVIKKLVWQIGRTGILTPTAVIEPIRLAGATISRATLHNMDEINRLDLRIGDTVLVERAGDVIPKIISVLKNLRDGSEQKIYTPKKCPICDSLVSKESNEVAYRCSNARCYAVNLRQIIHFVSKNALDIENLGPKVVEQLLGEGLISDFSDLYGVKKEDLLALERFAEKSAENLIKSISAKRKIEINRFIFALGIRHVGEESATSLSEYLQLIINNPQKKQISVDFFVKKIRKISLIDLESINDFGPALSKSLISFFQDEHNLKILEKLNNFNIKLIFREKKQGLDLNNKVFSKSFVLTGTLDSLTRDRAKAKIKELGGKVFSSINKDLDYLVLGSNPGTKHKKAQDLKVKILNESDFLDLIK